MATSPHSLVPGGPQAPAPSIYAGADEWAAYNAQQQSDQDALSALLAAEEDRKRKESEQAALNTLINFGVTNPGKEGLNTSASSATPAPIPAAPTAPVINPTISRDIYGVNAVEGTNRVNANADKFGVKATQDANGNITLTNVGVPQGTWYQAPATSQMPNVGNDLFAALNSLKGTDNPDVARGFLSSIRESAATQVANLQGEAMKFAATKLGVPILEEQLRQAEAADRADAQWYPGIGDSPITAKIRQALLVTRGSVDNEAKNYLSSNTTLASMNAALRTAEEEAKRIERISERKTNLEDRSTDRQAAKDEQLIAEGQALRNTLSPEELKRLTVLNPALASVSDPKIAAMTMADTIKRADNNPLMKQALGATEQDLPILAMENNPFATTLTVAKEQQLNPSANPDEIQSKLMKIAAAVDKPGFVKEAVATKFGPGKVNSVEAKAYAAELNISGVGLDAQGKKLARIQKYTMALDIYKAQATNRFMGDTSSWKVNDPEFLAAQDKAFKTTGKKDLDSVLTAYLQGADPTTLLQKLNLAQEYALGAASTSSKSLFGTPDTLIIKATIARQARQFNLWEMLMQSKNTGIYGDVKAVTNVIKAFLPEQKPSSNLIDPNTGFIRAN